MKQSRRSFLRNTAGISAVGVVPFFLQSCGSKKSTTEENSLSASPESKDLFFKISLAQWSLNRQLLGGKLTNLEFPAKSKNDFGIDAVEYVNQFFADKANDQAYLAELKQRTDDLGVENVLIMIDNEGYLAVANEKERHQAVENHYKWVEAAKFLGCHSIRVNAYTEDKNAEDARIAAIDGLSRLCEFAKPYDIGVIVENHGGFSSNGAWLASVMEGVNMENCGTLPDFGNFCINRTKPESETPEGWRNTVCLEEYDRYQGIAELMPYAKGVSAKSHEFDENGFETKSDYPRIMQIVKNAGYKGYVGIEFEGPGDDEAGIRATKELLIKVGQELS
ncbi:MAG: sugar phosphate isomerase/epimerase family protein [Cyclobacteriaceae bacterium]